MAKKNGPHFCPYIHNLVRRGVLIRLLNDPQNGGGPALRYSLFSLYVNPALSLPNAYDYETVIIVRQLYSEHIHLVYRVFFYL